MFEIDFSNDYIISKDDYNRERYNSMVASMLNLESRGEKHTRTRKGNTSGSGVKPNDPDIDYGVCGRQPYIDREPTWRKAY